MNYDAYSYLYPPRPKRAIPKEMLGWYESKGYIAQLKKNGTCTVIFARGNEVIWKTRHNDDHKAWAPLPVHTRTFLNGDSRWNVYVAELIHNKTPSVKNRIYVFDKIVHEGQLLLGVKLNERLDLLKSLQCDETHVTVAKTYTKGFNALMQVLQADDEGLVLKNPNSKLEMCREATNQTWQVKCRKPHTNYSF